jgi:chromosome segregation ATPase
MSANRSEPVRHTCPDIDRIIKSLKDAMEECKNTDEIDGNYIINELRGLESDLEDLRTSNSKLRDWGNALVDDLEEQDTRIEELENENETLKSKLDDAEEALKRYETESV